MTVTELKNFKSEYRSHIETFLNWYDASVWLEAHINEYEAGMKDDWTIEQASVNYINHSWRAGFVVSRKQGDLFDERS